MDARAQILITAAELSDLIRADRPVTILDVRWRLDQPDGYETYWQGHIPGAVYVSLEDELSDHTITGRGRHPLPSGRSVEESARRWGIRTMSDRIASAAEGIDVIEIGRGGTEAGTPVTAPAFKPSDLASSRMPDGPISSASSRRSYWRSTRTGSSIGPTIYSC